MSSLLSFEEVLRRLPGSNHRLDPVVAPTAEAGVILEVEEKVGALGQRLDMVTVLRLHDPLAMIAEGIAAQWLPLPASLRALNPAPSLAEGIDVILPCPGLSADRRDDGLVRWNSSRHGYQVAHRPRLSIWTKVG